jgi:ATP-dependent DNA helicase DinG
VTSTPAREAADGRAGERAGGPAPDAQALRRQVRVVLDRAVENHGGHHREGQQAMAAAVAEAVVGGRHLLVQAGTGTGKSWGYLVPALVSAIDTGEPVVVATSTLALQAQLVTRDLPRLADAVEAERGRRPRWALVKGRHHYVCRHRLGGGGSAGDDEPPGLWADGPDARSTLEQQVARVREWAQTTTTGDRDDLDPGVSERAWRAVSVTARECLGASRCPVAAECFSEAARRRAREAHVVVTNHALLAIDAVEGRAGLPEHEVVVVDEGHDLVDRVTGALTVDLAPAVVAVAAGAARSLGADPGDLEAAGRSLARALDEVPVGRLAEGVPPAAADALALVATAARTAGRDLGRGGEPGAPPDARTQAARALLAELAETAIRLSGRAGAVADPVDDEVAGDDDPAPAAVAADVLWVSEGDRGRTLHGAPLSVAGLLRSRLFDRRTAVLTSATLAPGGRFPALARRLGLSAEPGPGAGEWVGLDVGSPFDYRRQGILYVAAHLPAPGRDARDGPVHDELERLLRASRGGALGLFSSRRAAVAAAEALRERTGMTVLCQGEDTAAALVRGFAADREASLFGTLGLWQGVDVPGDSCRLVVIDRIPFPRPDDPLMSARAAAVDAAGGNGFLSVSVAHAATLLAQGAGRLIRGPQDRGVVAVLDSRLVTKRYGATLLDALPPLWRTTDPGVVTGALGRIAAG